MTPRVGRREKEADGEQDADEGYLKKHARHPRRPAHDEASTLRCRGRTGAQSSESPLPSASLLSFHPVPRLALWARLTGFATAFPPVIQSASRFSCFSLRPPIPIQRGALIEQCTIGDHRRKSTVLLKRDSTLRDPQPALRDGGKSYFRSCTTARTARLT